MKELKKKVHDIVFEIISLVLNQLKICHFYSISLNVVEEIWGFMIGKVILTTTSCSFFSGDIFTNHLVENARKSVAYVIVL